jgi:hypothetical protein
MILAWLLPTPVDGNVSARFRPGLSQFAYHNECADHRALSTLLIKKSELCEIQDDKRLQLALLKYHNGLLLRNARMRVIDCAMVWVYQ